MEYHLAQVNIARMLADLEDPSMLGFVERLDEINLLAESSAGFVWRYQPDERDTTYLRLYKHKKILFNMSVWESLERLKDYVYKSPHLELLKSKDNWFDKPGEPHMALWWVPKGHIPDINEGLEKVSLIKEKGASYDAFTFSKSYNPI